MVWSDNEFGPGGGGWLAGATLTAGDLRIGLRRHAGGVAMGPSLTPDGGAALGEVGAHDRVEVH